jgi:hypothetical protein
MERDQWSEVGQRLVLPGGTAAGRGWLSEAGPLGAGRRRGRPAGSGARPPDLSSCSPTLPDPGSSLPATAGSRRDGCCRWPDPREREGRRGRE